MRNASNNVITFALAVIFLIFSGCGLLSDGDHERNLAEDESVYEMGSPVPADGFDQSKTIILSVLKTDADGKRMYMSVENGEYMAPNTIYSMGITVSRRMINGLEVDQRVFISNGGWDDTEGYSVEAEYDAESDMYLADFDLKRCDAFLIIPILVQVIGADGKASKAKFLIATDDQLAASYGDLVDRGFSLTLSEAFLGSLPDLINPIIAKQTGLKIIRVNDISPAKNGKGKKTDGVINVNAGGISFDVILSDSKTSSSGETTRGLYVGVEDVSSGTMSNALEIFTGVFTNMFFKGLKLSNVPMMALGMDLGNVIDNVMGSFEEGLSIPGIIIPELEMAVDLDSTIYMNLKGYPSETTTDFAVLGGALYIPDNDDVIKNESGYYLWPSIDLDPYDTRIDHGMDAIMDKTTGMGIALSQYNMNQLAQALMQNLTVQIKSINTAVALFSPIAESDSLDLEVTINPKGIAIDFSTQRLVANDLQLLLVESGDINGPVSQLSLDITMVFDIEFRVDGGDLFLDLSVEPVDELCHMHVMKDESGLTSLDHGKFVPIIFQYIGGGDGRLTIPVPLSDMGIQYSKGTSPGTFTVDDHGNCFLGVGVESIDLDKLSTFEGCFIETALK